MFSGRLFSITVATQAMFSWDSFAFSSDSCPTPLTPPNLAYPDSELLLQLQGPVLLGVPAGWQRVCILLRRGERAKRQQGRFKKKNRGCWENVAFEEAIEQIDLDRFKINELYSQLVNKKHKRTNLRVYADLQRPSL